MPCYPLSMDFAIIKTGGKQYIVSPGQKLKVEKLLADEGGTISFDRVLLTKNGDEVAIGTPILLGALVEAKVLKQARARKIIVFKYKNKTRRGTKNGHRQPYTEVEIGKIKV